MQKLVDEKIPQRGLVGTDVAARQLGVTRRRIRYLCEEGRLGAVKVGRDWLVPVEVLNAFGVGRRKPGRPRNAPA